MINLLIFLLVCIGIVFTMLENAVEGYQDNEGFHYGKVPLDIDHEVW